ncbi:MAG TPA: ATP-binding cassette domain-containing protein, partial [Polyangiaceae bacterium]|nr:ATP-binding cassette domain-containing protein [Polyangiaceae bacterium]
MATTSHNLDHPVDDRRLHFEDQPSEGTDEPMVDAVGLAAVMETAAAWADVPFSSDQVLEVTTRAAADTPPGHARAIRAAAAAGLELGLLPVAKRPTIDELLDRCGEGSCIALPLDGDDSGRWLVIVGRTTSPRLTVYEIESGQVTKRRRGRRHVRRRLQAAGTIMAVCLSFEARYPLQAIHGGGNGGGPRAALERLWRLIHLESTDLVMVLIYAIFSGVLSLVTPVAVQALVNTIAFGSVLQPLIILTAVLLAGLAFGAVLQALRLYVVEVLQRRIFVRVATDFGRRIPRLTRDVHDSQHVPELANRFFDVITVQKAGSALAVDALGLVLQTAMGLCLLAFYHPILLAFDALLVVLLILVVVIPSRAGIDTAIKESRAKYATAAWLEAMAASPTLFRGAEPADMAAARTDALCRRYLGERASHWRKLLTQIAGGLGLQVTASVALLGVGGWLVMKRQLTLGQLVAAELVVALIGAGFAKLGKQLEKLYDTLAAMDKIGHVVDAERERDGGIRIDATGPMRLDLDAVTRKGPGATMQTAITATIPARARCAVVGPSGSGKSTLLEILAGIRAPTDGQLRADDVDLRRVDLLLFRKDVCVVGDEPLPYATIAEFLRLARPHASSEVLHNALRQVGLADKLAMLPHGLDTRLLPNGSPLSRTEARRLQLARALVQRPRLLILDGALDGLGLEPHEREALLDRFLRPEAPWTVVLTSELQDVLDHCDQ